MKFGGGTTEAGRFAFATGQETRAGKNFYPVGSRSDSFLPARAEIFQKSASGFSRKKVRISFRRDSQVVQTSEVASRLRCLAPFGFLEKAFFESLWKFCASNSRRWKALIIFAVRFAKKVTKILR